MEQTIRTWKVKYFQTARGNFPVKEFIEEQDDNIKARINLSIRLLVGYGPFLKPPDIKKFKVNCMNYGFPVKYL